jgi:electron transfer flavoprotein alpha subunit
MLAVLAAGPDGRLAPTASATLRGAQVVAGAQDGGATALIVAPEDESAQRRALGELREAFRGDVLVVAVPAAHLSVDIRARTLAECWPDLGSVPRSVVGEPWTETTFARLAAQRGETPSLSLRVRRLADEDGNLIVETVRAGGKLRVQHDWPEEVPGTRWVSLAADVEIAGPAAAPAAVGTVRRWTPGWERLHGPHDMRRLLAEVKREAGVPRLADAEFVIDVGYGVGNRDGYEAVIEPLERALRRLGVQSLAVGGSRKVTEELHLLPADRQIGQSGTSVNPRVVLAIGVSGAPQHVNYIGPRATILAFNRDPEAPLLTLNRQQPRPRVFPIVGDLFETVPAFIRALQQEEPMPSAEATESTAAGTGFGATSGGDSLSNIKKADERTGRREEA